ncbi:MAG: hypothetical protein QXW65_02990 [Candidatus Pacearchaeota archaeon]
MLRIEQGSVMSYWCFDVGNGINLEEAEKIFGKEAEKIFLTYERLTPEYVQYKVPPLLVRRGKKEICDKEWFVEIKIYDFGVIIVRLQTNIKGTTTEITKFLNKSEAELKKKVFSIITKVFNEIKKEIDKPVEDIKKTFSNYTIFFIQKFDRYWKPQDLLRNFSQDIANLLRYEKKKLSEQEIKDVLKNPLSYYSDDLTIIDFYSALVYDPAKSYDVLDVLEYAIIELTELRAYDDMLDEVIGKAYDELTKKKLLGFSMIEELSKIKLEISEIKEKVENFIKLITDSYLGKVYVVASTRFYLEKWKSSVKEKLDLLETLYTQSWERLQTKRMIILETAIVVLFIIDIILLLLEWGVFGKFP